MVEMMINLTDNYHQVDNETNPGRSLDQCGDQVVRLAQTQNQTNVEEVDDELVATEDLVSDVVDEDDVAVMLTAMKEREGKMGQKKVEWKVQ